MLFHFVAARLVVPISPDYQQGQLIAKLWTLLMERLTFINHFFLNTCLCYKTTGVKVFFLCVFFFFKMLVVKDSYTSWLGSELCSWVSLINWSGNVCNVHHEKDSLHSSSWKSVWTWFVNRSLVAVTKWQTHNWCVQVLRFHSWQSARCIASALNCISAALAVGIFALRWEDFDTYTVSLSFPKMV